MTFESNYFNMGAVIVVFMVMEIQRAVGCESLKEREIVGNDHIEAE